MKAVTKKNVTFAKYNSADYINTKETVITFLECALEENDPDLLLSVINDITRSKGMAKIAKELKLSRRGLYNALAPNGNPSFKTVFKLLDLLGLRIKLEQKSA